jgi:hypothetical protein
VPVAGSHGEGRLRWDNRGGCRLVELHGLLVRRVMIRRLKRDVMAQLPPKRRQVRAAQRALLRRKPAAALHVWWVAVCSS